MQGTGFDLPPWLVRTKLHPPVLRSDVIPRPHLLTVLRDALASRPVMLVSAPAGYGKTTLLTALPEVAPDLPLAWLTLDGDDNDPARFFITVVAALRQIEPECGSTALSLLAGPATPGLNPRHVAGALVNDVLESVGVPSVLVLDDLHAISEPMVYAGLDYFVERLPPQLHVVIAARQDPPLPLARLRARGQLGEVRVADLRFSLEEAADLLNDRLRLALDADDLTRLYARTEGWPAGLRLLAGSLDRIQSPSDRSAFIADLGRSGRHVFDFLAAEVFERQAPPVQSFLLETSILPELTSALCRSVTRRDDAAAMLEEIDRGGLFVVAVDSAGTTFRYHVLFAEFLQGRLGREMPGRVAELHRRAAQATTAPGRVIGHYLAAELWEEAAGVIEDVGISLVREGLLDTIAGWIQAIPQEARASRPRLALLLGVCSVHQGDLRRARAPLESARQGFQQLRDEIGEGEALAHLATCALLQMDFGQAGIAVEQGLRRPVPPWDRVQLLMARCWLAVIRRSWGDAAADLHSALAEVEKSGDATARLVLASSLRSDLAGLPGGLEAIERFIGQASIYVGDHATPLGVAVDELAAFVHFWRGRLDEAVQSSQRALAGVERLGGYPYFGAAAGVAWAMACFARGDYPAANRLLDVALDRLEAVPVDQSRAGPAFYLMGRSRLLQGDVQGAYEAYGQLCAAQKRSPRPLDAPLRLKLEARLGLAERRYAAAERALREAVALEDQTPLAITCGTARLLLSLLACEQNRPEAAVAELVPALEVCEQRDTPGLLLVDGADAVPVLRLAARRGVHAPFATRLLSLLGSGDHHMPITVPETGAVLSNREVEVLTLIAGGASNREIAEHLVVAESTVKAHVTSILRKLDVTSRGQAAARARELGISGAPATR